MSEFFNKYFVSDRKRSYFLFVGTMVGDYARLRRVKPVQRVVAAVSYSYR